MQLIQCHIEMGGHLLKWGNLFSEMQEQLLQRDEGTN